MTFAQIVRPRRTGFVPSPLRFNYDVHESLMSSLNLFFSFSTTQRIILAYLTRKRTQEKRLFLLGACCIIWSEVVNVCIFRAILAQAFLCESVFLLFKYFRTRFYLAMEIKFNAVLRYGIGKNSFLLFPRALDPLRRFRCVGLWFLWM